MFYKNLTFGQWIKSFEHFNNLEHYKKYLHSMADNLITYADLDEYYHQMYEEFCEMNKKKEVYENVFM